MQQLFAVLPPNPNLVDRLGGARLTDQQLDAVDCDRLAKGQLDPLDVTATGDPAAGISNGAVYRQLRQVAGVGARGSRRAVPRQIGSDLKCCWIGPCFRRS